MVSVSPLRSNPVTCLTKMDSKSFHAIFTILPYHCFISFFFRSSSSSSFSRSKTCHLIFLGFVMHALVTGCHVRPEEYPARRDANAMVWSTVERGRMGGRGGRGPGWESGRWCIREPFSFFMTFRAQELCESRGGRVLGFPSLIVCTVSVDVKQH